MNNKLIPGKLYKLCCYDELYFIDILSPMKNIYLNRGDIVLYLHDGGKLKIKLPGYRNEYFTENALFFLIGHKIYVQNINVVTPKLEIL